VQEGLQQAGAASAISVAREILPHDHRDATVMLRCIMIALLAESHRVRGE
jgi:hypothetical protein